MKNAEKVAEILRKNHGSRGSRAQNQAQGRRKRGRQLGRAIAPLGKRY